MTEHPLTPSFILSPIEEDSREQPPVGQHATTVVRRSLDLRGMAFVAATLSLLGVAAIAPAAASLGQLWRTDPLKSIGSLIPLVSLVLIARSWRALGWQQRGTWWGMVPLAAAVLLVALRQHALFELVVSPSWTISLPPPSLVVFLYGFGCVLFFGGFALHRAALFPVLLLVLVNPVPQMLVRRVDLPLQQASAHLARAVAQGLGAQLSPGQLRLMFTPEFGMFIAPGCDGIRGSVAMGLLGLVGGYVLRLRRRRWAGLVLAGISLGYLLNLLRLCGLVLYYVIALRFRSLQDHAEGADYVLGALLFAGAATIFFALLTREGATGPGRLADVLPPQQPGVKDLPEATPSDRERRTWWGSFAFRCAAFAALAGLAATPFARELWRSGFADSPAQTAGKTSFPARLGSFTLRRTWEEKLSSGVLLYSWAEYGRAGQDGAVTLGISPTLGTHDTLLCHMVRGEAWIWHSDLKLATSDGRRTPFSVTFFEDGVVRTLEAHTLCGPDRCGQYTLGHQRTGLILSFLSTRPALLAGEPAKPTAVLLRAESTNTLANSVAVREQLTATLKDFIAVLNPVSLSQPAP